MHIITSCLRRRPAAIRWHGVRSRISKRRRVRYVSTPLGTAIRQASVTSRGARDKLALVELSALDAITHGKGSLRDFRTLNSVSNMVEVLAKDFRIGGAEVLDAVQAAEAAFVACAYRLETTGRIGFTGPELHAVRDILEWMQAQRDVCSRGTYLAALRLHVARIKSGCATVELA